MFSSNTKIRKNPKNIWISFVCNMVGTKYYPRHTAFPNTIFSINQNSNLYILKCFIIILNYYILLYILMLHYFPLQNKYSK